MVQLAAFAFVIVLVFGALLATGGQGAAHALPFELALIGGAGLGTLFLGNSQAIARAALGGFVTAFRGPKWRRSDYADTLVLLSELMRAVRKGGFVAVEADIEAPETSPRFAAFARLQADTGAARLICDAFRLMALDLSDARRAQTRMDEAISQALDQRLRAVGALNTLADALPALGIVAAVLGIIRTMGAIDQAPAVLGGMIGSALLGTFLGVFLAYGIVGPVAARFGQIVEEDARLLDLIRTVLSAFGDGLQPGAAVELGRASLAGDVQPDTASLDQALSAARFAERARAA
jgi:chemotaxis protein MotA